jgi:hypothetical protein
MMYFLHVFTIFGEMNTNLSKKMNYRGLWGFHGLRRTAKSQSSNVFKNCQGQGYPQAYCQIGSMTGSKFDRDISGSLGREGMFRAVCGMVG